MTTITLGILHFSGLLAFIIQDIGLSADLFDPKAINGHRVHFPSIPELIFASLLLSISNAVGMAAFAIGAFQVMDGKPARFTTMFSHIPGGKLFVLIFLQQLLTMVVNVVTLGFLGWLVPFFLMFAIIAVAEGLREPPSAISESASLVGNNLFSCIGLAIISPVLISGGLLLGILPGILVTVPVVGIATAHYYRSISDKTPPPLS